jgi:hypothetical protein
MLPPIPAPGFKVRFLLHALHAGWSPVTKTTHRHRGIYQSNIKDSHLVLFKGRYFLVLGKAGATLVMKASTRSREYTEVSHFGYNMNIHPRHPFLISHFGQGRTFFNLEFPEMGCFKPVVEGKGIRDRTLRRLHKALEDHVRETGVAPSRGDFLKLVQPLIGNQHEAHKLIVAGIDRYWKAVQEPRGYLRPNPPIRHYPVVVKSRP